MEGRIEIQADAERPWQVDRCQFFTRDKVAELCLRQLTFPKNLLTVKLLEPAAGLGAFFLPLLPLLVRACRQQEKSFDLLRPIVSAYEIDIRVAAILREQCAAKLEQLGVSAAEANSIARIWINNRDFLEARPKRRFTHIVGNPPYIRWDSIPTALREGYKARFGSFRQRADLYVAFIEHALVFLEAKGQLAFLCPGNWTRNVYGSSVRQVFTSQGQLKSIIDFSDVDSFETSSDAYPHFFVFEKGSTGPTKIFSMAGSERIKRSGNRVVRKFSPSSSPLLLSRNSAVTKTVNAARQRFPKIEDACCCIRVGSATGCNEVFLGSSDKLPIERSRLLPFVNAGSIQRGKVHWDGTHIVNVFDSHGNVVDLSEFPRLAVYLREHQRKLQSRAKASTSRIWWRSIDNLHPDWYFSPKLLVVDVSAIPVVGIDDIGYCAGSGVYQIKSSEWPLKDLLVFLSAGVLGLFVGALSAGASSGFHRFQKSQLAALHVPKWEWLDAGWKREFKEARRKKKGNTILELVAELYGCEASLLQNYVARDWGHFCLNQAGR
jgi:hypothetical protein